MALRPCRGNQHARDRAWRARGAPDAVLVHPARGFVRATRHRHAAHPIRAGRDVRGEARRQREPRRRQRYVLHAAPASPARRVRISNLARLGRVFGRRATKNEKKKTRSVSLRADNLRHSRGGEPSLTPSNPLSTKTPRARSASARQPPCWASTHRSSAIYEPALRLASRLFLRRRTRRTRRLFPPRRRRRATREEATPGSSRRSFATNERTTVERTRRRAAPRATRRRETARDDAMKRTTRSRRRGSSATTRRYPFSSIPTAASRPFARRRWRRSSRAKREAAASSSANVQDALLSRRTSWTFASPTSSGGGTSAGP